MRYDPASAAMVVMLRGLKMFGVAQAAGELMEQGSPAFEAAVPVPSQLLSAEMAEREVRSIAYQLKAARFSTRSTAASSWTAPTTLFSSAARVRKNPCRDGLGVQTVEHHRKKARFFSTVELDNALEQAKAQGKAGQRAERLVHTDLVILDELGYLLFSASGGVLHFHMLSKPYEGTSVVITTNLCFSEWAGVSPTPR